MTGAAKAKMFVATCEDCGNRTETNRKNMKYCHSCRLLRNCLWLAAKQKTVDCMLCEQPFLPIERGTLVCGDCNFVEHYHGDTACVVCGETGPAVRSGVRVCWGCATDPTHRARLMKALADGRRSRVAANDWTPGTQVPIEPVLEEPARPAWVEAGI